MRRESRCGSPRSVLFAQDRRAARVPSPASDVFTRDVLAQELRGLLEISPRPPRFEVRIVTERMRERVARAILLASSCGGPVCLSDWVDYTGQADAAIAAMGLDEMRARVAALRVNLCGCGDDYCLAEAGTMFRNSAIDDALAIIDEALGTGGQTHG